ncbi:hypothetical protein ACNKHT_02235 [Shigella flexneri]
MIAVFNIAVMASVYFSVPDNRDEAKGKLRTTSLFTQPGPVVNFRRHDVWQRRCVCLVQLRKAIHDVSSGFSETAMTFIMMLVGLGMVSEIC